MISDFGFNQSTFSGIERGESYRVQIRFHSGGFDSGFFLILNLNLSGTAGKFILASYHNIMVSTITKFCI